MNINKYILLLLVVLGTYQVNAKGIKGWVYDKSTKEPLIGVNVYWVESTHGAATNADGFFEFDHFMNPNQLVFSYVGYVIDTIEVKGQSSVKVYLKAGTDVQEVVVVERVKASSLSKIDPILTQNISDKELTKFACCNLSESFETNASVDVAYADAVSGIKQIKMLGLSGRYSQLMLENIPIIRGGETAFGLDYIPGTWMKSIQVSKGTSAVKNGYESVTGQININYHNPGGDEKLHLYFYANQDGKVESNAGLNLKVNKQWSTNLLIHGGSNARKLDMNNDGFLDKPTSYTGNFMNRWNFKGKKVEAKLGISYLNESRKGGQLNYNHDLAQQEQGDYGIGIDVNRLNAFSKVGFLLSRPNTSIGWITSANYFERSSFYGYNILDVEQYNLYTNVILQSYIGSTIHTYNTGYSLVYDHNGERLNTADVGFNETVPGVFFEYNYIPNQQFSMLLGLRNDYSSLHGNFVTPRAHAKYSLPAYTTFRASAGKGYRTPTTISENTPYLATSKQFVLHDKNIQEEAWNYGLSMVNDIPIGKREATVSFEYFRTDFNNQLVVDLEQNYQEVHFYNLQGKSYANSFQVEAFYELFNRFEVNAGYRWNDVKSTYSGELKEVPFVSRYKALLSAQYRTNLDKWQFDATLQFHGQQRLLQANNPSAVYTDDYSQQYVNLIAQVTKNYRYWSFYVGAENLTNFVQENPIIASNEPFGTDFDASQIWGPVYGRMFYLGIKYKINQ